MIYENDHNIRFAYEGAHFKWSGQGQTCFFFFIIKYRMIDIIYIYSALISYIDYILCYWEILFSYGDVIIISVLIS